MCLNTVSIPNGLVLFMLSQGSEADFLNPTIFRIGELFRHGCDIPFRWKQVNTCNAWAREQTQRPTMLKLFNRRDASDKRSWKHKGWRLEVNQKNPGSIVQPFSFLGQLEESWNHGNMQTISNSAALPFQLQACDIEILSPLFSSLILRIYSFKVKVTRCWNHPPSPRGSTLRASCRTHISIPQWLRCRECQPPWPSVGIEGSSWNFRPLPARELLVSMISCWPATVRETEAPKDREAN